MAARAAGTSSGLPLLPDQSDINDATNFLNNFGQLPPPGQQLPPPGPQPRYRNIAAAKEWARNITDSGDGYMRLLDTQWETLNNIPINLVPAHQAAIRPVLEWLDEEPQSEAAWAMLLAYPAMTLRKDTYRGGKKSGNNNPVKHRLSRFATGDWANLWDETIQQGVKERAGKLRRHNLSLNSTDPPQTDSQKLKQSHKRAIRQADFGNYGSARDALSDCKLAPANENTLQQLREKHPQAPAQSGVPDHLRQEAPAWAEAEIVIEDHEVIKAISKGF